MANIGNQISVYMYASFVGCAKTVVDRCVLLSLNCMPYKLSSNDLNGNVLRHDLDLVFEVEIFESSIFPNFVRDYLPNFVLVTIVIE